MSLHDRTDGVSGGRPVDRWEPAKRLAAGVASVLILAVSVLATRACGPESLAAKVMNRHGTPNQRFLGEMHHDAAIRAWFPAQGVGDELLIEKAHAYCARLASAPTMVDDMAAAYPNIDEFRAEFRLAFWGTSAYCPRYTSRFYFRP